MIFALVGNQNCGKTTLFNALTGSNQHVGNFPRRHRGPENRRNTGAKRGCSVVDLPGIYSLRPYTRRGDRLPGTKTSSQPETRRHHQHRGCVQY